MHVAVMLRECLEYLALKPDGVYLDATAGLGGHTGAMARLLTTGSVLACDRDAESLVRARENLADHAATIRFCQVSFSRLGEALAAEGISQPDALLSSIPRLVKPGGRAVVVTFMSLEDRKVKHGFQAMAKAGRARILTRHVVRPAAEEVRDNPPSRSAKLRAVELL